MGTLQVLYVYTHICINSNTYSRTLLNTFTLFYYYYYYIFFSTVSENLNQLLHCSTPYEPEGRHISSLSLSFSWRYQFAMPLIALSTEYVIEKRKK